MARYDKYIMKYIGLVTLIVLGVWNWNSLMGLVGSIYKTLGPIINGGDFRIYLESTLGALCGVTDQSPRTSTGCQITHTPGIYVFITFNLCPSSDYDFGSGFAAIVNSH